MINSYVSIDLETTGLHPKWDKIIEIGAVRVTQGTITEQFSTLINPARKLESRICELTGIRDEDLAQAPFIEEVFPTLQEFLGDSVLLGHRILFDYSFLKKAAADQKLPFEKQAIDTLQLARAYLPNLEHRTLEYLCRYYEIPHQAHRAWEDARATHYLYQRLLQEFYKEEEKLFCPQPLIFKIKRDTPATKRQKERLYQLLKQHKIEPDYDVDKLTRREASRLTDKLLARYGR